MPFNLEQRLPKLFLVLLMSLTALSVWQWRAGAPISASLLDILPQGSADPVQMFAQQRMQERLDRELIVLLRHPEGAQAGQAFAEQLTQQWRASGIYQHVEQQLNLDISAVRQQLLADRSNLLPLAVREQLARQPEVYFQQRLAELFDPLNGFALVSPEQDWLGLTARIQENLQVDSRVQVDSSGYLFIEDAGQHWLLLRARTHDGAFAGSVALQVAEQVQHARTALAAQGGELLASSGLLFAAQGQTQAAREMQWLGGLSLLGSLLLIVALWRSVSSLVALLPALFGLWAGATACIAVYGQIHVLTLVLGASLIGVLCLLLAQGLRRRLSAAWMLTTVLLLVGAVLSLLKGFDWEEATILVLTASLLGLFRRSFYRPSRLTELPFSPLYLVASACVLGASMWLLLFAYQDVPYSHQLWWQFTLDSDAPRGLRSLMGAAVLLVIVSLTWLLRTARPTVHLPDAAELEKAEKILLASDQPDGGLALTGDKALLFHPDDSAFLMYARRGRSLVALYDPIGPPQQRAELIWQFRDLCDTLHARPVFYQVRAQSLPFYMDIGLTAIKLGEEARVDLHRFDLEAKGKEMKDLRYTWNRGTRDGLSLEIHEPGEAPMDELKVISDAWLTGKNVREKGFSLGRFSEDYIKHFRVAIIRFEGKPVAFANLLETHSHELSSLDLMRAHPEAPKLTMEFMMVGLIQHYKKHGYARFSLGMVPLSGLQPRRGAPLTQRLGSMLFQRGEHLYNFQGLRRFKDKFQPDWEPRYMAVPAGLDPLVALADTAALIAGGLTGLVKR